MEEDHIDLPDVIFLQTPANCEMVQGVAKEDVFPILHFIDLVIKNARDGTIDGAELLQEGIACDDEEGGKGHTIVQPFWLCVWRHVGEICFYYLVCFRVRGAKCIVPGI